MKASVLQDKLLLGLNRVGYAIEKKSYLPILSCVLLKTEDARLVLSGTNLELGIVTAIGAKVDHEGAIALNYAELLNVVKAWPKDERIDFSADLTKDGLKATFTNWDGSNIVTLDGMNPGEFPNIIEKIENPSFTALVAPHLLARTVESVSYCAAKEDEHRPILKSVNFWCKDEQMRLASSDGIRLATGTIETVMEGETEFNIPAQNMNKVVKLINMKDPYKWGDVTITLGLERVVFEYCHTIATVMLLEGRFPDIMIVAQSAQNFHTLEFEATVKVEDIKARLKMAKAKYPKKVTGVLWVEANGTFNLCSKALGFSLDLPASYTGRGKFSLNIDYLNEFVNHTTQETIQIEGHGEKNPIVLSDGAAVGVVMPLSDTR